MIAAISEEAFTATCGAGLSGASRAVLPTRQSHGMDVFVLGTNCGSAEVPLTAAPSA